MKRGTLGFPPVSPWLLLVAIAAVSIEIMSGIPGYDSALSAATLAVPASPAVRQPWETNKVMRMIFGGPDEAAIKRPRLNLAGPSFSSASAVSNDTAQTLHLAKTVPRVRPTTQHLKATIPELDRQRSNEAWLNILRIDLSCSKVGRQIETILSAGYEKQKEIEEVGITLTLSSRSKSANTIGQRAAAFSQYVAWAVNAGWRPLPVKEEILFTYLRSPNMSDRGPANASRLLESMGFAYGIWGIDGALEASTSARVKGLALDIHLTKRSRVPAEELTDLQLYSLEACMADERASTDTSWLLEPCCGWLI